MPSDIQRKLTTILAADAAGYSRVMEADEVEGLRSLRAARAVFKKLISRHRGRVANTAGDGLIAEFPSVVEAVQCAIEVQRELGDTQHNPETALNFRIGIHLGDVMIDGEDLLGEGVNLAARLQTMAEPGGILISQQVYDQVHGKLTVGFDYLGERRPRNFSEGVQVYCVSTMGQSEPKLHIPEPERPGSKPKPNPAPKPEPATRSGSTPAQPEKKPRASEWPDDEFDEVLNKPRPQAEDTDLAESDLKAQILKRGKLFGLIFGVICLVDITSDRGIWAHWPGLVLLTIWALQSASLWANEHFSVRYLRLAILVSALVMINIFSWSGYFWALWPAGALIIVEMMRRRRHST